MEQDYASAAMAPGQSVSWKNRVLERSSLKPERAKARERQHLVAFALPAGHAPVLPLPLVPFESYMLADHRPAYPMNCIIRLRCAGRFDRPTLDTAMSAVLAHHPLLGAIARPAGSRWVWEPTEHPPAVAWLEAGPAESLPHLEPLDVRVAPGLRVVACEGPTQTDLTLQAHHACCDGLGLFLFAEDLLMSYAVARGLIPAESLRPIQPEDLRTRGRFGLTTAPFFKVLSRQLFGLAGARQFLMRTPEPLAPHRAQPDDAPLPPDYPASWTRQLDEAQTAGLLAAARRLGVTLNDLLARELFLCLARWQHRHGRDGQRSWLRLCVPVSLRTTAQDRWPAANSVGMLFLDRRPRDAEAPDRLLASVHKEMQLLKRMQLGWTFVLSLGLCRWLPGGLARRRRNPRCMSTAVLTNLGVLFARCPLADPQGRVRIGDITLEHMDLLAPWRPLTCAAFTVWSYAGRLSFTLHYDSRVLAADEAGELLDHFVELSRKQACRTS